MNYQEARSRFRNGDVVFFSNTQGNFVRKCICWFTRGIYYHAGIVFWASVDGGPDRLFLAESQPDGYRTINLGSYSDRDMTVFRCPVEWLAISDYVVSSTGSIAYSLVDLTIIGLHERFGYPAPQDSSGSGEVCSVLIAKILRRGGMVLNTMVSPQRLFNRMSGSQKPFMVVKP